MKGSATQNVIRVLVGALLVALFAGSIAVITARSAHASAELHELYRGARAQAMGNAFTAVADDEEAIFYNPAGLAGVPGFRMTYFDEVTEVSTDSLKAITDNIALFNDFNISKLNALMGENIYMRSQFTPSFVLPNFGFSVIIDDQFALNLKNQALPNTTLGYQQTNGVQVATGFSILPKSRRSKTDLRVGFAGKMLWRRGGYRELSLPELLSLNQSTLSEGAGPFERGMGIDLGVQGIRQVTDSISFSAGGAFQNIGDVEFGPKGDPLKSTLNLGVAATYKQRLIKTTLALDERHVLESADFRKKMHMGLEFALPIVSVYGGLSETNLSYGATVDLWYFRVSALTYSEELSTYAGQDSSRRYMFRIAAKFGF